MVVTKFWHKVDLSPCNPILMAFPRALAKKFAWGCGVIWVVSLAAPADSWLGQNLMASHPAWGKSHHKKSKQAANTGNTNSALQIDPSLHRGLASLITMAENGQLRPFEYNRLVETVKKTAPDLAFGNFAADGSQPNQILATYLQWEYLTSKKSLPKMSEIEQFMAAHPNWPQQDIIKERAEASMVANESDAEFLTFAAQHPPVTKPGNIRWIQALLNNGKRDAAAQVARRFWASTDFTTQEELSFLQSYQSLLTQNDFDQRMEFLLWHRDARAAYRDLKLVSPLSRQISTARLQLQAQAQKHDLNKILSGLPTGVYSEGLNFDRINWLRRKGELRQARQVFANLMPPPPNLADRWWVERYAMARSALRDGQAAEAYHLVSEHNLSKKSDDYSQAEFFAGWIALTGRNDPEAARQHFQNLYEAATVSYSHARGGYWLGRTAEIAGNSTDAVKWYNIAAAFPISFYGQIATERLRDLGLAPPDLVAQGAYLGTPYPLDSKTKLGVVERAELSNNVINSADYPLLLLEDLEDKAKARDANNDEKSANGDKANSDGTNSDKTLHEKLSQSQAEIAQAARRLIDLGGSGHAEPLIKNLAELAQSPSDMVAVGDLALASKRVGLAVWVARKAQSRFGSILETAGYPILGVELEKGVESALMHALIRQESSFLPHAQSRVGARGLMQLMPATAKSMARQLRLPYARAKLVDVNFNVRLGGAYLKQLLQTYRGDYVLAVAAYNAGPGRVNAWLDELGDPRDGKQDVVAWIEQIPFTETRIYVQRVLEGLKVYRRLLAVRTDRVKREGLPFTVLPPTSGQNVGGALVGASLEVGQSSARDDIAKELSPQTKKLIVPAQKSSDRETMVNSENASQSTAQPALPSSGTNAVSGKQDAAKEQNKGENNVRDEATTPIPPPIFPESSRLTPPPGNSSLCDRNCMDAQTIANLNGETLP
ncbi:MAG: lytic transglycosylase domain-containing protein [Alphaproteobacteria bacterium]|nr:lytic transglycosylase domain-containing protein [Alphaproteobacteria bacterium]